MEVNKRLSPDGQGWRGLEREIMGSQGDLLRRMDSKYVVSCRRKTKRVVTVNGRFRFGKGGVLSDIKSSKMRCH